MNQQFKVTLTVDLLNQVELQSNINFLASYIRQPRTDIAFDVDAPDMGKTIHDMPLRPMPEGTKIVQVELPPEPEAEVEAPKKTRKPRAPKAEPQADQFEQLANLVLEKFKNGSLSPADMQALLAKQGVKSLLELKGTDKVGVVYASLLV